jgi:hypothetical protein
MQKKFNVTGVCIPGMHYMVDISGKVNEIIRMIEEGAYFTINKPRQYGKTTTLYLLAQELKKRADYLVLKISFEGVGDESYKSEKDFIKELFRQLKNIFRLTKEKNLLDFLEKAKHIDKLGELNDFIAELVIRSAKKVVLMIDEVDQSSNNRLFLNFLGMLRNKYLLRSQGEDYTFQSVILAGVYDVKSLKLKVRPNVEQKYNSPWNIATDFEIDLGFSAKEIATMLSDYSQTQGVNLDLKTLSEKLYYYTSGYPYLVSKLCKIIDEKILAGSKNLVWRPEDVETAVQMLIKDTNTNFESLIKNIENNQDLYEIIRKIIMEGESIDFVITDPVISQAIMYGIFKPEVARCQIHNKVYEQLLYNHLTIKTIREKRAERAHYYNFRDNFIENNETLNFEEIILKYQQFMKEEYSGRDVAFLEREGRLLFLAFIKPIINGRGYDFKEVEISEEKRLDVVVTYLSQKYVVELKIWRGLKAHERGILQLCNYLNQLSLDRGYLVIYDFTKSGQKEWKQDRVSVNGKEIFMVWV